MNNNWNRWTSFSTTVVSTSGRVDDRRVRASHRHRPAEDAMATSAACASSGTRTSSRSSRPVTVTPPGPKWCTAAAAPPPESAPYEGNFPDL